jgi:hypothetical protein
VALPLGLAAKLPMLCLLVVVESIKVLGTIGFVVVGHENNLLSWARDHQRRTSAPPSSTGAEGKFDQAINLG